MRFGTPVYFWLMFLIPLLAALFILSFQSGRRRLERFLAHPIAKRMGVVRSGNFDFIRFSILIIALFFLIVALTTPKFGLKHQMFERKGVDVMVALDVSKSMLAEDITPNRIDRAKHEIGKLIDLLKGDRVGIIIFAGESFVQCPLTLDYGAAKMFLDAVETDWIEAQGTDLSGAIEKAVSSLDRKDKKHKVMILISDGEDHEGNALSAAKEATKQGLKIYTVGIGSEDGVPIPVRKNGGNVIYKKDSKGNLVLTKLNSKILEKIALESGGKYFHAGTDLDLVKIYSEISKMQKKSFGMNSFAMYREQYQIFLFAGILFFMIYLFMPSVVMIKAEEEYVQ